MRVGILSGTFDPIHDGHLALARVAKERGKLDKVVFLPEHTLRRKNPITSFEHRLAMCKLASESMDWLAVLELSDNQFTIKKTLPELQEKFPDNELVFIMGSDLFAHLPDWPDIEKLVEAVRFIVSIRDSHDASVIEDVSLEIGTEYMVVKNDFPSLSSSQLRTQIYSGADTYIDGKVFNYIKAHNLYR